MSLSLLLSVSLSLILYLSLSPRCLCPSLCISLSESVCVCFSPVSLSLCVFLSLSELLSLCLSLCLSVCLFAPCLCVSRCPCPSLHGVCSHLPSSQPTQGRGAEGWEVGSHPNLPRPIVKRRHFQNKSNSRARSQPLCDRLSLHELQSVSGGKLAGF